MPKITIHIYTYTNCSNSEFCFKNVTSLNGLALLSACTCVMQFFPSHYTSQKDSINSYSATFHYISDKNNCIKGQHYLTDRIYQYPFMKTVVPPSQNMNCRCSSISSFYWQTMTLQQGATWWTGTKCLQSLKIGPWLANTVNV